mgnify:CR=1 FL=1
MKASKTTAELVREAFIREGCRPLPVGYTPPKRKAKAKHGKNGTAKK